MTLVAHMDRAELGDAIAKLLTHDSRAVREATELAIGARSG